MFKGCRDSVCTRACKRVRVYASICVSAVRYTCVCVRVRVRVCVWMDIICFYALPELSVEAF